MLLLIWCCKRKSLRQRRMLPHGSILLTDYSFTRGFTPAVVRRSAVTEQIGLLGQSQLLPGKHCPSTLAVYEHQAAMLWTWSPLLFNSSSCSSALCRLRTRFTCRVRQLDPRCCCEDRSLWAWQSLISGCCQPESHFVHFLFLARSSLKPSWFWLCYSLVGCVGHRFVVCHEFLPLRSEHAQEEFMNPNQIEAIEISVYMVQIANAWTLLCH